MQCFSVYQPNMTLACGPELASTNLSLFLVIHHHYLSPSLRPPESALSLPASLTRNLRHLPSRNHIEEHHTYSPSPNLPGPATLLTPSILNLPPSMSASPFANFAWQREPSPAFGFDSDEDSNDSLGLGETAATYNTSRADQQAEKELVSAFSDDSSDDDDGEEVG